MPGDGDCLLCRRTSGLQPPCSNIRQHISSANAIRHQCNHKLSNHGQSYVCQSAGHHPNLARDHCAKTLWKRWKPERHVDTSANLDFFECAGNTISDGKVKICPRKSCFKNDKLITRKHLRSKNNVLFVDFYCSSQTEDKKVMERKTWSKHKKSKRKTSLFTFCCGCSQSRVS